ncbi:hypothetical protein [Streptomyces sp.]|uniref:hypothetical protein n=1 Tax=Streptomyces sp. TaxID=1931 RepID=UPI002F95C961
MTARRLAGWALLSLIPAAFVLLAALSGQWAEVAIGVGVATLFCLVIFAGLHLIHDK